MVYNSGELVQLEDKVSDNLKRTGTVLYLMHYEAVTEVVVEWSDGTVGIHHLPEELVLIEREGMDVVPRSR